MDYKDFYIRIGQEGVVKEDVHGDRSCLNKNKMNC